MTTMLIAVTISVITAKKKCILGMGFYDQLTPSWLTTCRAIRVQNRRKQIWIVNPRPTVKESLSNGLYR